MRIYVGKHQLKFIKEEVNEKEINITKCEFEFDNDITDEYVKEAYFTLNKTSYKQLIVNNECYIPSEVLNRKGIVELGVVAYLIEDGEYVKRYNPTSIYFPSKRGSLKENYENAEHITPTDIEQLTSLINSKQEILVSGTNIKTINNQSILGSGNITIQGGGGEISPIVSGSILEFLQESSVRVENEEVIF